MDLTLRRVGGKLTGVSARIALSLMVSGCITASEPAMPLGAISTKELPREFRLIAKDVSAELCPGLNDGYASYSKALELALAPYPEANALLNAKFERSERLFWICVRVSGDAVAL